MFECTWAKLFWQELREVTKVKVPELHLSTWAMDIIYSSKVSAKDAAIILCGGWFVWSERNVRHHDERVRSVSESVKWTGVRT